MGDSSQIDRVKEGSLNGCLASASASVASVGKGVKTLTRTPQQQCKNRVNDYSLDRLAKTYKTWCGWRGSNPRPLASEANTLSTELQPHMSS